MATAPTTPTAASSSSAAPLKKTPEQVERQLDDAMEDSFSTSDPIAMTMPDSTAAEELIREKANSRPLGMIFPLLMTVAIGLVAVNALRRYLED